MNTISGTIAGTGAAVTELAYSGGALVGTVQLVIATITGGPTTVQVSIYDNNVVRNATTATGAVLAGTRSPGYLKAVGPGTTRQLPQFYQTARVGDQQGQTQPNAGAEDYWNLDGSNNLALAATPVVRTAVTAAAAIQGNGSFPTKNMTVESGSLTGQSTAARLLYSTTLAAGQAVSWTPPEGLGVSYGINIVAQAATATAITGSYNAAISPTP